MSGGQNEMNNPRLRWPGNHSMISPCGSSPFCGFSDAAKRTISDWPAMFSTASAAPACFAARITRAMSAWAIWAARRGMAYPNDALAPKPASCASTEGSAPSTASTLISDCSTSAFLGAATPARGPGRGRARGDAGGAAAPRGGRRISTPLQRSHIVVFLLREQRGGFAFHDYAASVRIDFAPRVQNETFEILANITRQKTLGRNQGQHAIGATFDLERFKTGRRFIGAEALLPCQQLLDRGPWAAMLALWG